MLRRNVQVNQNGGQKFLQSFDCSAFRKDIEIETMYHKITLACEGYLYRCYQEGNADVGRMKEDFKILLDHWEKVYLRQARMLASHYHVILPTLDGHGEEFMTPYISTEESAAKIIAYINENCSGSVFAVGGVSLGEQIVMEILCQSPDIAQKAIIDGSICVPQPRLARCCSAVIRMCWPLLFSRKACKLEVALLNKCMPKMRLLKEIVDLYMKDMPNFRKETMCTIYRTYMAKYQLDDRIKNVTAQVLYWYGSKEMKCVKKSAAFFKSLVPSCQLYEAKGYGHGYLAAYLPEEWMKLTGPFLAQK